MRYYLQREGTSYGPYSEDEVKQHVASGNIGAGEWLVPEEGGAAVPVSQIAPIGPVITRNAQPVKKGGLLWLWITLGIGGGLMLLCCGVGVILGPMVKMNPPEATKPLLQDRAGHRTVWTKAEESGEPEEVEEPPAEVFQLVRYPSPAGELAAYLTPDPKDGKKHPAVVWAKGGFGGIGSFLWEPASHRNDQSARAFREAGLVLMCPSWRGENDNPGRFEFFYGEVEDFLAAIEYVKKLPYVDPNRVYIGGHSTGGTLTLLAAAAGADYRAAFSFGGAPDMVELMSEGDAYGNLPYDVSSTRDHELRSAIRYAGFIKHPTFYFEGSENTDYVQHAKNMQFRAGQRNTPFQAFSPEGDHFNILAPLTQLLARKIQADTGTTCNISFTHAELARAQAAMAELGLAHVLNAWLKANRPPDLKTRMEKLGEDAIPYNQVDIAALRAAVEAAAKGHDLAAAQNLATLAMSGQQIPDEEIATLFRTDVVPSLRGWISEIAESPDSLSEEMLEPVFQVLYMIAWQDDEAGGKLLARLIQDGFAPSGDWSDVFEAMETGADAYLEIMDTLRPNPPTSPLGNFVMSTVSQHLFQEEWDGKHPYDSPAGGKALRGWLEGTDPNTAYNAAFTLAFVSPEIRAELLPLALAYNHIEVRLEGAWADVRNKGTSGIPVLQEACLDLNHSALAKQYLSEFDLEKSIPAAALQPEFAAKAGMVQWLSHPNELGGPPATIELFDHRTLYWPPTEERTPVWLFKYTYRFEESEPYQTGYGMFGTMTWSFFGKLDAPPTPEQLYAKHCALELSRRPGMKEDEGEVTPEQALELLRKHNPGAFGP